MIDTPAPQTEHKPDGLNILDALFREVKALREKLEAHEERLNNLTLNIPEQTVNAIVARTLDLHAQVLQAAVRPVQSEQEKEATPTQDVPKD